MLIGLLSDTHIPYHAKELPEQLKRVFHNVDLILHAGDIYVTSVLDELETIAPVFAAEGDDDYGAICGDRRVEKEHLVNINGVTIWLFHEYKTRSWIGYEKWEVRSWNREEKHPDVIVYGHTHEPALENGSDILRINPGSATFPYYKYELGTVGLLSVNSGEVEAQVIQLR